MKLSQPVKASRASVRRHFDSAPLVREHCSLLVWARIVSLAHSFACIKTVHMIVGPLSLLGLGNNVEAWAAKFHGEKRGSHWLLRHRTRLPLVDQAVATWLGGGVSLYAIFTKGFVLNYRIYSTIQMLPSTRNCSLSNESF